MTRVRFAKMHGTGNDFVVVDCLDGNRDVDWGAFARRVLDRHFGVGGDQLLLVQPSHQADFAMGIRNADGSPAEMCANGIRAFMKYLRDRGHTDRDELSIETQGGVVVPRWLGDDTVEVRMPEPCFEPQKIPVRLEGPPPLLDVPLDVEGERVRISALSMGNPHCVVFVDDLEDAPVERLGPALEQHSAFPERTNVEFVYVRSPAELEQRTWERGSGETLACGSGACAAAVAAILNFDCETDVRVRLRGGDLRIRWPEPDGPVWLTGPAAHVFDGELEIP